MSPVEPLTNVDAAWLRMEDPTNLMMISGIFTFDKPVDFAHLRAVVEYRLLKYDRFRQRVVQPKSSLSSPYWETDPNFTLSAHMHRIALPAPGDKEMLQTVVSDFMSMPLDFSKPPWQVHLIENFGEGCAVMCRLHHCIADGMALMQVLLSLTDMYEGAPPPTAVEKDPSADEAKSRSGPLTAMFKRASSAMDSAMSMTKKVVSEGLETMINPVHALELAIEGTDNAVAAGKLIFRPPDPQTIFKGPLGVPKLATWTRPLPLKEIKLIKNSTGTTVNDVLVSIMTGALRRYMIDRGESVEGLNFRATVPVDLRTPDERGTLGNKFGLVFLSLPLGIADPLPRLQEVQKRMLALKNSKEAPVALGILNAMAMTPADVQGQLVDMFGSKATAVLTNVPGPPIPLYLAGQKISGLMFWVPQSGRVSMGLSILSYAGNVFVGLATDQGLIPDPDKIIDALYAEYDLLIAAAAEKATADAPAEPAAAETAPEPAKEAEAAAAAPSPTAAPGQCHGLTKSGTQCRRKAQDGSEFCYMHQP